MGFSYYDPNLVWHPEEPFYPPTSVRGDFGYPLTYYAPADEWVGASSAASLGATSSSPATASDFFSQLGHGISDIFSHAPDVLHAPAGVSHALDKAGRAADNVSAKADAMSEDTRRAMQAAEETAKAIKYVVYGVGALAGVALVFSIIRSAID
jgi:hypothetical protein